MNGAYATQDGERYQLARSIVQLVFVDTEEEDDDGDLWFTVARVEMEPSEAWL